MPAIKYVSLSDLHLGEEDSLLTAVTPNGGVDVNAPSPVLRSLAECLAVLVGDNGAVESKPTLILNGDVLELALARDDEAALGFYHFLAATMPAGGGLFGEIICLAGNHDHHLWETARETQYVSHLRRQSPDAPIDQPWHTTKTFVGTQGKDRLVSEFLTAVAHRHSHLARAGLEILMAYPSFGVARPEGGCAIFHHGHFVEPLYHLMSTIDTLLSSEPAMPATLDELEKENFAWIDFFWSMMGRSGRFGGDLERVYEATGDREGLRRLTDTIARNIARRYDLQMHLPDFAEEAALKGLFRAIVDRVARVQERQRTADHLTASCRKGLRWLMEELLPNHVREKDQRSIPEPVTFVFGHTHKPFEEEMNFAGYSQPIHVLNQGGWIVESIRPEPLRGAAVVLVDEELNAVNLRMYDEGRFEVRVAGAAAGALRGHVEAIIARDPGPWRAFSEAAEEEVRKRAANLAARTRGGARRGPALH